MRRLLTPLALALCFAAPALAQDDEPPTPASVVAASTPDEWTAIDPADLLVMELAPDARGEPRTVVIQLMPPPFSQGWVGNVRKLAQAHWWDGTSVYRVVDNWVTQWGDVSEEKPLPEALIDTTGLEYVSTVPALSPDDPESLNPMFTPLRAPDPYVGIDVGSSNPQVAWAGGATAFSQGWPVALIPSDPPQHVEDLLTDATFREAVDVWPTHCYGTVGVARNLAPDTGTGSELYAVIGHAPRQLDRNIAVVGRVIEGIEYLSTLPRGTGEAGVYEERSEDTPIVSVRLASELPAADQPNFEYLASDSTSFAEYVRVRANRNDSFYKVPAGGIDVCNVQVPIRRADGE